VQRRGNEGQARGKGRYGRTCGAALLSVLLSAAVSLDASAQDLRLPAYLASGLDGIDGRQSQVAPFTEVPSDRGPGVAAGTERPLPSASDWQQSPKDWPLPAPTAGTAGASTAGASTAGANRGQEQNRAERYLAENRSPRRRVDPSLPKYYFRAAMAAAIPTDRSEATSNSAFLGKLDRSVGVGGDAAGGIIFNPDGENPLSLGFAIGGQRQGVSSLQRPSFTGEGSVPVSGSQAYISFMPEVRVAQRLNDQWEIWGGAGVGGAYRKARATLEGSSSIPGGGGSSIAPGDKILEGGGFVPAYKIGVGTSWRPDPTGNLWFEAYTQYQGVGGFDYSTDGRSGRLKAQNDILFGLGVRVDFDPYGG